MDEDERMIYASIGLRLRKCRKEIWKIPGWRRIYDMGARPVQNRVLFVHYELIGPKVVLNEVNR